MFSWCSFLKGSFPRAASQRRRYLVLASDFQRTCRFCLSSPSLPLGRSGLQRYDLFINWQAIFSIIFYLIMYKIDNQICKTFIYLKKRGVFSMFSFVFGVFDKPKNGVLAGLDEADGAHKDEISKNGFGFSLINVCQLLEFLQRDLPVFRQMAQ